MERFLAPLSPLRTPTPNEVDCRGRCWLQGQQFLMKVTPAEGDGCAMLQEFSYISLRLNLNNLPVVFIPDFLYNEQVHT